MKKNNLLLIILVLFLGCSNGITGYYKMGIKGDKVFEVIKLNDKYEYIHSIDGRNELQHIIDNKYVMKSKFESIDSFATYIDFDIPYLFVTTGYASKKNFNLLESEKFVKIEKVSKKQYDQLLSNLKK